MITVHTLASGSEGNSLLVSADGTHRFVLAHLSRENNTPQRALQVMETALSGLDVSVEVAPRGELSGCYAPEVIACRR